MRVLEAWWVQAVESVGDTASQPHGFTQSLLKLRAAACSSILDASPAFIVLLDIWWHSACQGTCPHSTANPAYKSHCLHIATSPRTRSTTYFRVLTCINKMTCPLAAVNAINNIRVS